MDDIADAKVKAKIENAQAKVKARLEEREVKGSTKRKSEETLPRPTENRQGNAAPTFESVSEPPSSIKSGKLDNPKLRGITDAVLFELRGNTGALKGKKHKNIALKHVTSVVNYSTAS